MAQHYKWWAFCLCFLTICPSVSMAQKLGVPSLDSLITVGYATGKLKNVSGSVEKVTENQMNREQITSPLDAIRG
jgi:outer membrane receptor for ferrienterochelin and colicin